MTLTQYKKIIKSLTRDELETHLFDMFKSSKVFKDIESSCWNKESNDEMLDSLRKRLEKVFWSELCKTASGFFQSSRNGVRKAHIYCRSAGLWSIRRSGIYAGGCPHRSRIL